jgi:hypothetical protein
MIDEGGHNHCDGQTGADVYPIICNFSYLRTQAALHLGNLTSTPSHPRPSHPLYTQHYLPEVSVKFCQPLREFCATHKVESSGGLFGRVFPLTRPVGRHVQTIRFCR